jgi:drug/metabolite transporter (DMT)-like permease
MARADASFVAPISYATLVFAALYDFTVFRVVPDHISLTGSAIILSGGLVLVWREARTARPITSRKDPNL